MGPTQSKVKAMYLPAQSGKTGKMNNLMILNKHIEEIFGEGDINFIISSNNLVLVEQTKQRVESALQEEFIGDVYTWRSGKKQEKMVSSKDLAWDITNGDMETIVMCANAPRMKHLSDTIKLLEASHHFKKKINIWIDEADASIQLWKKYEHLISFSKVESVTFVSATFKSIFKRYGRLYVYGEEHTHPECYRCLRDSTKVEVNIVGTPLDYVKYIVTTYGLAKAGVRAFVPGDITQSSHNEIASYLQEQGFVVVILNGERKEILIPGKASIDLKPYISSEDELNTTLAKLYHENNWNECPFAVTGHYCVGRGVTFQCIPSELHQGFLFTHGILSPITDAPTAYQIMARLFGNIGNHPDYSPCTIYSTHSMFSKVEKQESCALNLARMIRENGDRGAEVGEEEILAAQKYDIESAWTLHRGEFTTLEEANEFLHSHGARRNHAKKEGDFYKSSLNKKKDILQYEEVITTTNGWSKLSGFDVKLDGTIYGRMIICYKDITDPTSVMFVCRIIKK